MQAKFLMPRADAHMRIHTHTHTYADAHCTTLPPEVWTGPLLPTLHTLHRRTATKRAHQQVLGRQGTPP